MSLAQLSPSLFLYIVVRMNTNTLKANIWKYIYDSCTIQNVTFSRKKDEECKYQN